MSKNAGMKLLFFMPMFFFILLFAIGHCKADATQNYYTPTDVFPNSNQSNGMIFLTYYNSSGRNLYTPDAMVKLFYKLSYLKGLQSDGINSVSVQVKVYCRGGGGDPGGGIELGQGNGIEPWNIGTKCEGSLQNPDSSSPYETLTQTVNISTIESQTDQGQYGDEDAFVDLNLSVDNDVAGIGAVVQANGATVTFDNIKNKNETRPVGDNNDFTGNETGTYDGHGDLPQPILQSDGDWRPNADDTDTAFAILPNDDGGTNNTYYYSFTPNCSLTAPETIYLRWYDADQGDPTQSTEMYMDFYDVTSGKYLTNASGSILYNYDSDLGGNDSYREVAVTIQPGHKYTWSWTGVDSGNGIQFWLPFSPASSTLDCTSWNLTGQTNNKQDSSDSNQYNFSSSVKNESSSQSNASYGWFVQDCYAGDNNDPALDGTCNGDSSSATNVKSWSGGNSNCNDSDLGITVTNCGGGTLPSNTDPGCNGVPPGDYCPDTSSINGSGQSGGYATGSDNHNSATDVDITFGTSSVSSVWVCQRIVYTYANGPNDPSDGYGAPSCVQHVNAPVGGVAGDLNCTDFTHNLVGNDTTETDSGYSDETAFYRFTVVPTSENNNVMTEPSTTTIDADDTGTVIDSSGVSTYGSKVSGVHGYADRGDLPWASFGSGSNGGSAYTYNYYPAYDPSSNSTYTSNSDYYSVSNGQASDNNTPPGTAELGPNNFAGAKLPTPDGTGYQLYVESWAWSPAVVGGNGTQADPYYLETPAEWTYSVDNPTTQTSYYEGNCYTSQCTNFTVGSEDPTKYNGDIVPGSTIQVTAQLEDTGIHDLPTSAGSNNLGFADGQDQTETNLSPGDTAMGGMPQSASVDTGGSSVNPGGTATANWTEVAPSTPGIYTYQTTPGYYNSTNGFITGSPCTVTFTVYQLVEGYTYEEGYDNNRIPQSGIVIYDDNGNNTTTDSNGYYEFVENPGGTFQLSVIGGGPTNSIDGYPASSLIGPTIRPENNDNGFCDGTSDDFGSLLPGNNDTSPEPNWCSGETTSYPIQTIVPSSTPYIDDFVWYPPLQCSATAGSALDGLGIGQPNHLFNIDLNILAPPGYVAPGPQSATGPDYTTSSGSQEYLTITSDGGLSIANGSNPYLSESPGSVGSSGQTTGVEEFSAGGSPAGSYQVTYDISSNAQQPGGLNNSMGCTATINVKGVPYAKVVGQGGIETGVLSNNEPDNNDASIGDLGGFADDDTSLEGGSYGSGSMLSALATGNIAGFETNQVAYGTSPNGQALSNTQATTSDTYSPTIGGLFGNDGRTRNDPASTLNEFPFSGNSFESHTGESVISKTNLALSDLTSNPKQNPTTGANQEAIYDTQCLNTANQTAANCYGNVTLGSLSIPEGDNISLYVQGNVYINGDITYCGDAGSGDQTSTSCYIGTNPTSENTGGPNLSWHQNDDITFTSADFPDYYNPGTIDSSSIQPFNPTGGGVNIYYVSSANQQGSPGTFTPITASNVAPGTGFTTTAETSNGWEENGDGQASNGNTTCTLILEQSDSGFGGGTSPNYGSNYICDPAGSGINFLESQNVNVYYVASPSPTNPVCVGSYAYFNAKSQACMKSLLGSNSTCINLKYGDTFQTTNNDPEYWRDDDLCASSGAQLAGLAEPQTIVSGGAPTNTDPSSPYDYQSPYYPQSGTYNNDTCFLMSQPADEDPQWQQGFYLCYSPALNGYEDALESSSGPLTTSNGAIGANGAYVNELGQAGSTITDTNGVETVNVGVGTSTNMQNCTYVYNPDDSYAQTDKWFCVPTSSGIKFAWASGGNTSHQCATTTLIGNQTLGCINSLGYTNCVQMDMSKVFVNPVPTTLATENWTNNYLCANGSLHGTLSIHNLNYNSNSGQTCETIVGFEGDPGGSYPDQFKLCETSDASSSSLVPSFSLHATGNIYISNNVKELDGSYSADPPQSNLDGDKDSSAIYTCGTTAGSLDAATDKPSPVDPQSDYPAVSNAFAPVSSNDLYTDCNNQLVVYGSLAADHVNLMRTYGTLADEDPTPASAGTQPGSPVSFDGDGSATGSSAPQTVKFNGDGVDTTTGVNHLYSCTNNEPGVGNCAATSDGGGEDNYTATYSYNLNNKAGYYNLDLNYQNYGGNWPIPATGNYKYDVTIQVNSAGTVYTYNRQLSATPGDEDIQLGDIAANSQLIVDWTNNPWIDANGNVCGTVDSYGNPISGCSDTYDPNFEVKQVTITPYSSPGGALYSCSTVGTPVGSPAAPEDNSLSASSSSEDCFTGGSGSIYGYVPYTATYSVGNTQPGNYEFSLNYNDVAGNEEWPPSATTSNFTYDVNIYSCTNNSQPLWPNYLTGCIILKKDWQLPFSGTSSNLTQSLNLSLPANAKIAVAWTNNPWLDTTGNLNNNCNPVNNYGDPVAGSFCAGRSDGSGVDPNFEINSLSFAPSTVEALSHNISWVYSPNQPGDPGQWSNINSTPPSGWTRDAMPGQITSTGSDDNNGQTTCTIINEASDPAFPGGYYNYNDNYICSPTSSGVTFAWTQDNQGPGEHSTSTSDCQNYNFTAGNASEDCLENTLGYNVCTTFDTNDNFSYVEDWADDALCAKGLPTGSTLSYTLNTGSDPQIGSSNKYCTLVRDTSDSNPDLQQGYWLCEILPTPNNTGTAPAAGQAQTAQYCADFVNQDPSNTSAAPVPIYSGSSSDPNDQNATCAAEVIDDDGEATLADPDLSTDCATVCTESVGSEPPSL